MKYLRMRKVSTDKIKAVAAGRNTVIHSRIRHLALFAVIGFSCFCAKPGVTPKGKALLEPFGYHGVSLDGGRLKAQFDLIRSEYLGIPNDDLLKGFRARAGFPAPGNDLADWYVNDTFHIFGQIVSGLSRMYAATGDRACLDKVNFLVSEWAKCIAPDGYFYYTKKPNAPHYTYDKMVGGLVDAYLYCGNTQARECLSRITDWAIGHLDKERKFAFNQGDGNTEWYTLTENLYRAYLATGDVKYRDFGAFWEYTDYWGLYARNKDIFADFSGYYHAYSHVNTLAGAGAAYLVSGEQHYLDTLIHAYDYLTTRQAYATGGFGPDEGLQRSPQDLVKSLTSTISQFETQCGSWAAFKMVKYLIELTGDARYGDWAELLTYNGIGASVPMNPAGAVQYYSDYGLYGGTKRTNTGFWQCCAGTRPEAAADYYDLIWFKDAANLYVNLFTPSTVRWSRGGQEVAVSQTGTLEAGRGIEFKVAAKAPARFGLRFRIPGWAAGSATVSVNGKKAAAKADDKHWLGIDRTWSDGDVVELDIPFGLYAKRLDPDELYPSAVMYGPVVLAGAVSGKPQASRLDMRDIQSQLEPDGSSTASFHLKSDRNVILKPFYTFGPGEEYFMYIDPRMTALDGVKWTGRWTSGNLRYSNEPGATVEGTFTGTGILWKGYLYDDAGRAEVRIDGKTAAAAVDQYGPVRDKPFEWKATGLARGKHAFVIRILKTKNVASKSNYINIRMLVPID